MNNNSFDNYGKTEPVGDFGGMNPVGGWGGVPEDIGKTVPSESGFGATQPVPTFQWTEPSADAYSYDNANGQVTEPITPGNVYQFMPVVGWLVCVEGPDMGRDYRIHAGYNTIGREAGNDICISGDQKITRVRHALVAFDSQECMFFFAPGNSVNLVRLNGKVLMVPTELHANDELTVGSSKLLFIPFCSEAFSWEKK